MKVLADNILYLKKNNPDLYIALKKNEEELTEPTVFLEDAKNSQKTLKIKRDNAYLYLHSKYDPIKEAELIIDKLEASEELTPDKHVVFYGLGLGYHLEAFLKRFPKNEFSIYEPSAEVFNHFLNQAKLTGLPLRQLVTVQCGYDESGKIHLFNTLISKVNKDSVICNLPSYQMVFKDEYQEFLNQFREAIKNKTRLLRTNYTFKKRWILNSAINFKEVLTTPSILQENNGIFKGKTAILVSAGPSLNYEIENLKLIKEKKMAYIFAVGSALNTLVYNDIYPDAMCTYDPLEENQVAFIKVNELNITSIPVIFGSSVGFETLQNYQGPKYHMLTSQDTVSQFFLRRKNKTELISVNDAPSIAVVTLELLNKLGFEQIILVGQNLAYKNKKYYADGIDYQILIDEKTDQHLIKTVDVNGNDVLTNESFNSMRKRMEADILSFGMTVINTTVGGAKIEGTQFRLMADVIKEKLTPAILDGDEFKNIIRTEIYDYDYIKTKLMELTKAYEEYKGLLLLMKQQLIKIDELVMNKNAKQAAAMYQKFDQVIVMLEANDFAKVFGLPMNRVEHELLAMNVQRIKKEKNELKKIGALIAYVNAFVDLLYGDSQLNQQIIEKLTDRINAVFPENLAEDSL